MKIGGKHLALMWMFCTLMLIIYLNVFVFWLMFFGFVGFSVWIVLKSWIDSNRQEAINVKT